MKNLVIVVLLVAAGLALYFYAWPAIQGKYAGQSAEDRVQGWLEAQKRGDEQTALCMWAQGKTVLPIDEMRVYTGRYDEFRKRHGFMGGVESYSIEEVDPPRVTVRINGTRIRLRVEPGEQIQEE